MSGQALQWQNAGFRRLAMMSWRVTRFSHGTAPLGRPWQKRRGAFSLGQLPGEVDSQRTSTQAAVVQTQSEWAICGHGLQAFEVVLESDISSLTQAFDVRFHALEILRTSQLSDDVFNLLPVSVCHGGRTSSAPSWELCHRAHAMSRSQALRQDRPSGGKWKAQRFGPHVACMQSCKGGSQLWEGLCGPSGHRCALFVGSCVL